MNVFWRELRAYKNSTIIWAVSLSLLAFVFLSMFPSFTTDVESTKKILANLPQFVTSAIGVSFESLFSIYGFMSYVLTFGALAGAIQAMNLGVGVLSKEESNKTADFLLTKPISRTKVVTSKMSAAFTLIIITNITFCLVALMMAVLVSESDFNMVTFLLIVIKLLLIQTIFLFFGFLVSVILPKIKSSIAVSLPTVFTFFIVGTLGSVLELDIVRYISPFKFFDSNYIIANGAYEIDFLIITFIFVVLAIVASYVIFIKKDIRAAS